MNKYELALVVNAKIEDEARAAVVEKAKGAKDITTLSSSKQTLTAQQKSSVTFALWTMY